MADGEKTDCAPAQPPTLEADDAAAAAPSLQTASHRSMETPELDRFVNELQARSTAKATEGAFTSRPTPPPSDAISSREEVGLERIPTEFPPTLPVDGSEARAARSRIGRFAFLLVSHRFELGQIRRPLVPVAILSAVVGIGVVSMMVLAPENATTPVTTSDHAASDAPVVAAQDRQPQELSASLMTDLQRQEQPVQEPITPKLVKTVRIYEAVDQREPNSGPWSESAAGNASIDERLQIGQSEPASSEEALTETKSHSADADRWPVAIAPEGNAQSEEPTAAPIDEPDLLGTLAERAAGSAPLAAPAPELPAAEGDEPSVAAAAPQEPAAEPARFAPVTTHVNMRSGPASDAEIARVVPAGARVGVVACENWCEVVFEGERGWIHRSFVTGASRDGGVRQIAAGTPLISADGAQLGVIRGRSTDAAGQAFIVVDLAQELKAADRSVRLRSEHIVPADGQARINVTRAQFVRSLP